MGVRFACAYFALYFFTFPLGLIPWSWPAQEYTELWQRCVPWVAAHVLHLAQPITVFPAGSGNTTYNYVELLCFGTLALTVTLVWSALGRAREHARAHELLRILRRFAVGSALIGYGVAKIIKTQFPFPGVDTLLEPYGEASPMGLLWTFMGFSTGYNIFVGLSEAGGGVLLFYRRTTTLGALILVAVMANVVALNFFFDTPVKLYSLHLLAASAFLALPDLGRLWNVLVAKRATTAIPLRTFRRRWLERLRPFAASAYLAWILYQQIPGSLEAYRTYGDGKPKSPLYGAYEVVGFTRDDEELGPDDPKRWKQVSFNAWGYCLARGADASVRSWRYEPASSGESVRLFAGSDEKGVELETVWNDPEHLDLAGELEGALLVVQLKKKSFLLETRGFHWVNETPFNR